MTAQEIHEHYYKVLFTEVPKLLAEDIPDREKFAKIVRLAHTCSSNLAIESLDYANFQDLNLEEYEVEPSGFKWHHSKKQGFLETGETHSG